MPLRKQEEFAQLPLLNKSPQNNSSQSDIQFDPVDPEDWKYVDYVLPGLGAKPSSCKMCPYSMVGQSFCPDYKSENPKIALLLEAPGATEILDNTPLVGRAGQLMWEKIVPYANLSRSDFIISNTIRCRPPENKYPSSFLKRNAENNCRRYDSYINDFDPNIFIITYHPASVFRQLVYQRLIQEDIKKAKEFYEKGYRPLVLMGDKAVSLLDDTPFKVGKGGLRMWRGSYFEGSWPFYKNDNFIKK